MSKPSSPTRFSGESDRFYDPNFTAEISQKMRVPKTIKVDGESDEQMMNGEGFHHWIPADKLEMQVPDKIVVLGHDKHHGTKSIPRELEFENLTFSAEPIGVRVQTPPKVLTLDHQFYSEELRPSSFDTARNHRHDGSFLDMNNSALNDTASAEGMTVAEEVVHLRKQLAKLNRRVMSIELDNLQRQQKEKILYVMGLAYLFFKTVVWLSRSN